MLWKYKRVVFFVITLKYFEGYSFHPVVLNYSILICSVQYYKYITIRFTVNLQTQLSLSQHSSGIKQPTFSCFWLFVRHFLSSQGHVYFYKREL